MKLQLLLASLYANSIRQCTWYWYHYLDEGCLTEEQWIYVYSHPDEFDSTQFNCVLTEEWWYGCLVEVDV